jgi:hypothetical protein
LSILIPGRAEFYDDSPLLTPEQAQNQFADWFSGERILSGLVAVGRIIPNEADEALLEELQRSGGSYSSYCEDDSWFFKQPVVEALRRDFLQITEHDMSRVSVTARQDRVLMEAGSDFQIEWHPDIDPFVRWNVSDGKAGTEGAKGWVCKADVKNGRLETMFDEKELIHEIFPAGTVLRFLTGDIHRSPTDEENAANRIFMSSTVSAADYRC